MKIKVILSIAVLAISWSRGHAQNQPFNIQQILSSINQLMPMGVYNQSCVSAGCPAATTNPCPEVSNASSVLPSISVFNTCAVGPMCGLVLDPQVVSALTLTFPIPNLYANATSCSVPEGSSVVSGVSHSQVVNWTQVSPSQLRVLVTIPEVEMHTFLSCNNNVTSDYRNALSYNYYVTATPTDLTVSDVTFLIHNMTIALSTPLGNNTLTLDDFSPQVVALVGQTLSPIYAAFYTQIYQQFYQLARANCPK